jgi:hypothetical protein
MGGSSIAGTPEKLPESTRHSPSREHRNPENGRELQAYAGTEPQPDGPLAIRAWKVPGRLAQATFSPIFAQGASPAVAGARGKANVPAGGRDSAHGFNGLSPSGDLLTAPDETIAA